MAADLAGFTAVGSMAANLGGSAAAYFLGWDIRTGMAQDYYPDFGYDYDQPGTSQTWYYCSDPAGYYPNVTQCNIGWQAAPAS